MVRKMVQATLAQLQTWYVDPSQGGDRPKLISKMATIELCGWLEGQLDRIVFSSEDGRLNDPKWLQDSVLTRNNGFTYNEHLRPMLCKLIGEILVRKVEAEMEEQSPGNLDQLKSILGTLWKL
jgi:hypothetical protein